MYNLSVVQLCPAAYKDTANAIAEASGYGPNNLSVPLQDPQGNLWYGCHAWWMEAAFEAAATLPQEIIDNIPGAEEAFAAVVTSSMLNGDPASHWAEALSTNNLTPTT